MLSESATLLGSLDDPTYPRVNNAILLDEISIDIYKYGQNVSFVDQSVDWVVNVTFGVRSVKSYASPTVTLSIPDLGITSQPLPLGSIAPGMDAMTYVSANWSIPDGIPERCGQGTGPSDESITQTITTGFRTIQLMQTAYSEEEIASRGNQYFFPFDSFYTRINPDVVRWVLESAVQSGQNMLRVWGGGSYQPSDAATDGGLYDFYSLCDELGILVWSELIFSDTLYPINPFLLESVEPEVRQNVRRINKHPSNAQWAGGNEVEGIVMSVNTSLANGTHYLDEEYLYGVVLSETNSVPYTDCSTTHGVLSLDPYVLRFANGTPGYIYGNSEQYNYDATQAFNLSTYPVSRFHSMPSFYTWKEVLENPEDFTFNSTVVMSRDHHPPAGSLAWPNPNAPQGQYQMTSAMTSAVELWLPAPGTSDANQTFAQWCWSTQLFQSMNMVAEIAWYRRGAGMGENNLGSLVWQLNDIWQGVSWSAIEYSGRWKVLNYGLASAYAPVIIQPFWMPENETLTVLATSDRWENVNGVAQLTWYDWSGRMLKTSTTSFSIPALNNSLVYEGTGLATILPAGYNASDVWLLMNLTAQADNETVTNESYFTPISLTYANLVDPKIVVRASNNYTFTLSAQSGVGAWTWLDHPYGTVGYFVDTTTGSPSNGFYLVPGIDRTVQFVQNAKLSSVGNPDPSDFVVRSLWNNTHV
ncbi:glycoside hydrolase [Imleria badia]|nr:glycoside hydrolase [Imleria badia]